MATDALHAALLQRLGVGGGGPPGPDAGPPDAGGPEPDADDTGGGGGKNLSPLDGVQSVIQDLHDLMKLHPDPDAVSVIATCLKAMTALQQKMMATQGGGPGGPG